MDRCNGTDRIFKYLDERRLQRVNDDFSTKEVSDSHGREYTDYSILGYNAV
jgi:hypothetical protein